MTVTAYDSVDISTVPSNAQYLLGYNSGAWPTVFAMRDRWPKLARKGHIKSIAVQADVDGDVLDCEPGDASPDEVANWVQRQYARGAKRPIVYSSVSQFPQILTDLNARGISRDQIGIWSAHYNGSEHICSRACNNFGFTDTADATQWTSSALGRNLDQSLCQDEFWNVKPTPNQHYDRFFTRIEVNKRTYDERAIVEEYDRLRGRPLSRIILSRPKLTVLRAECLLLADRVARVALYDDAGHKRQRAEWGVDHRGFRYAGLLHRSQGRRVA